MTVTFKGDREIDAFLAQLPLNLQRNTGRRALRRGAIVLRDAAKDNISSVTGLTAADIVVQSGARDGFVTAKVKMKGGKRSRAFIGWFLEFGVAPHYISSGDSTLSPRLLTRKREREGTLKIADNLVQGPVFHPGFSPRPFMRPALDTHASEAIDAIGTYLRAELAKNRFRGGGSGDGGDDE